MAISGKFLADFSSFQDAVQKAEVSLKGFEQGAGKVETSLNRVTNSLSGTKLIQDATIAAAAVERIGGVSKLTESELARLSAQAKEAAAKMTAMGQTVPPGIQKIADSAKTSSFHLDGMKQAIVGAFSIAAVTNAVNKFTQFTGTLTDLSAKTGISTTELQKLKFAAEQNGGTIDGVTGAIGKMGKALVEGKDSTVEGMKRLGLSINDVRQMQPGEAFATIADKIAKVPSPLERSKLAMDLFGKSGADLLPMMTGHLSETMAAAERLGIVLDEQTIKAGDDFGDTLGALQSVGMVVLGKVLSPMLPAFQMVADAMLGAGKVVDLLRAAFDSMLQQGLLSMKFLVDAGIRIVELGQKVPGLSKVLGDTGVVMSTLKDTSTFLTGAVVGLSQETKVATASTDKHRTSIGLATEATTKHATEIQKLTDKLGGDAIKTAENYLEALKKLPPLHTMEAAALVKVAEAMEDAIKAYEAQGKVAPASMQLVASEARKLSGTISDEVKKQRALTKSLDDAWSQVRIVSAIPKSELQFDKLFPDGAFFTGQIQKGISGIDPSKLDLGNIEKVGFFATKAAFDPAKFGEGLGRAIFGAVQGGGNAVFAGASFVGETVATHIAKTLTDKGSKLFGTALGGAVDAILPGIGSLLGPLIGKIASVFDRNKGRDIVEEFAKGFGGFDALQKKLAELGDEGARLWVMLTQGVGRNNKDQARAAVEAVTAALEKHKTAQEAVKVAAEEATAAEVKGFEEANDALKTLDGQIKSLEDSIANEAPEEVMGIVEAQTRARIEGLKQERAAAQDALTKLAETMTQSIDGVKEAILDLPKVIKFNVEYGGAGGGRPAEPSSFLTAGARTNAVRAVPGGGDGVNTVDLLEQLAAQNAQLITLLPKAITAAMQKAAA